MAALLFEALVNSVIDAGCSAAGLFAAAFNLNTPDRLAWSWRIELTLVT